MDHQVSLYRTLFIQRFFPIGFTQSRDLGGKTAVRTFAVGVSGSCVNPSRYPPAEPSVNSI